MSLPAADLPAPVAVLILAWDEAAPAVRALVEATQARAPTVDSILVMVPQADAPDHLSAEEYLPLPPAADYAAPLIETAQSISEFGPATPQPAAWPASSALAKVAPVTLPLARPELPPAPSGASAASPSPASKPVANPAQEATGATPIVPGWAAVRVLRLGHYSVPELAQRAGQPLPTPVWTGAAQLPTAPYLGAAPPTGAARSLPSLAGEVSTGLSGISESSQLASTTATLLPRTAGATPPPGAPTEPSTAARPAAFYKPAEPQPQAALETDLPPSEEETELLPTSPPDDLPSEYPLLLPVATTAQAGWPEALAALRQPTTLPAPTQTELVPEELPTLASPAPAALQPAATHYPAADLNFQVIQYARFAVPVALAEADFAAIYAPAWPTWLAAQELRQRTGRPLVLHVATLAANSGESVATATGWMADLQRQALQRADLILAETPALAERLRHELGLPFATVQAVAAADALAIAQALHTARARSAADRS